MSRCTGDNALETKTRQGSSLDRPVSIPAELFSDGHLAVGLTSRFSHIARWATVADVPDRPLPPIPSYDCLRVPEPPRIDGVLDEDTWARARWSEPFRSIGAGIADGHETTVALLWDDTHLYAAYRVGDPDVRASSTTHHDQVYMTEDDVEIFVEG
jgi:hypothetical protein